MSDPATSNKFWAIDPARTWPPGGAVHPPLSPTNFERLRVCWLQATFRATPGYPPRSTPRAALGTAFHDTLEHLPVLFAREQLLSAAERRAHAVAYFRAAVQQQRERARNKPRERKLPWPDDVVQEMTVQIAIAASAGAATPEPAIVAHPLEPSTLGDITSSQPAVAREATLTSRDNTVTGRPDLVEFGPSGPIIIDYKTGKLDDPDRLASYRRQCFLYAWLWHETYNTWPVEYRLVHQASGVTHRGAIDTGEAQHLGEVARAAAMQLAAPPSPAAQATVGPHCTLCAYRPWCEPYWLEAAVPYYSSDNGNWRTRWTFAATLLAPADRRGASIILSVRLKDETRATVEAPFSIFPHLANLPSGAEVRILDAVLNDGDERWLVLNPWGEAYIVSHDADMQHELQLLS